MDSLPEPEFNALLVKSPTQSQPTDIASPQNQRALTMTSTHSSNDTDDESVAGNAGGPGIGDGDGDSDDGVTASTEGNAEEGSYDDDHGEGSDTVSDTLDKSHTVSSPRGGSSAGKNSSRAHYSNSESGSSNRVTVPPVSLFSLSSSSKRIFGNDATRSSRAFTRAELSLRGSAEESFSTIFPVTAPDTSPFALLASGRLKSDLFRDLLGLGPAEDFVEDYDVLLKKGLWTPASLLLSTNFLTFVIRHCAQMLLLSVPYVDIMEVSSVGNSKLNIITVDRSIYTVDSAQRNQLQGNLLRFHRATAPRRGTSDALEQSLVGNAARLHLDSDIAPATNMLAQPLASVNSSGSSEEASGKYLSTIDEIAFSSIEFLLTPTEKFKVLQEMELPGTARDVFVRCFSDNNRFDEAFHNAREDRDVKSSPWELNDQKVYGRTVNFVSLTRASLGPKSAPLFNTQRMYLGPEKLIVEQTSSMKDIPYSDSFRVEMRYVFATRGPGKCIGTASGSVHFVQRVRLIGGTIESSTLKQSTETARVLMTMMAEELSRVDGGGTVAGSGAGGGGAGGASAGGGGMAQSAPVMGKLDDLAAAVERLRFHLQLLEVLCAMTVGLLIYSWYFRA